MAAQQQTTIVPKGHHAPPFDRDRALERLFAIPLPPHKVASRPYPIDQPLGRIMRLQRLRVHDVDRATGISYRTISNYLAGRVEMLPKHRALLAEALHVDPRIF